MKVEAGDIVRVSKESRSKAAGRFVEVVGLRTNLVGGIKEVKVRIIPKHGHTETQLAYVHPKFLESTEFTGYIAPVVEEVETIDQSHVGVDFKWKLGKSIRFITPVPFKPYGDAYETKEMAGWITDQWVEDGVKLYNIVFRGTYKVVPEQFIFNYCGAAKA
ncbi:modifier of transcription [Escherichia phage vB_EcoM_VR20]|uniref:Modifier of transcription n=1 Tax=Escherichia phage vB_EcoM_VR20 TaxID=1567027 RepID=A0A0A7HBV8_9CAUD|nr:MotB-like transcriptional regulator [Escherichia phage vB_EcoM_VR20]AIZ02068.1 modifier of transcription [Escherichia phage vB_EcoM_VR20]